MLGAGIDRRRFRVLRIVLAAGIVILAAPPAWAQGDPEVGRELARTWCTSCHVVDLEGRGADAGPALPALLGDGQRNEDELCGWLAAPHPPMPDFALSRQEIEDITAYLQSLTP
jgi:mono/diheme cytochrome c family protein